MSLDLNKLENKLDEALSNETSESLNKFLNDKRMTNNKQQTAYQEAIEKSFKVKWQIGTCSQGEKCWCRTIKPVDPIFYEDGGDSEYYVVGMGELSKETAEYFVQLHNATFGGGEQ